MGRGCNAPIPTVHRAPGHEPLTPDPHAWIDGERDRLISELADCCRFPSVSATASPAREELAGWLENRLEGLLGTVERFEPDGCAPIVLAETRGRGSGRLLLYSHYDVQPAEPLEAWTTPPFVPEIRDGALFARGVCDDKADVMARIHALEAWRACHGEFPFTIAWICEGDEEIGSPGMPELIEERREWLMADGCLWESYLRRGDGDPEIGFGCRGMLHVELSLQLLAGDQHSAFAAVYRSAPAELARALASLVDATGRVQIAGFHDAIREPGAEEQTALASLPVVEGNSVRLADSSPFVVEDPGELRRRLVYEPTANITGMWSGASDGSVKTIVPACASARVDFRLVPDQRPDEIAELLRAHLDSGGFHQIGVKVLTAIPAARSPLGTALGRAATRAAQETMGRPHRYPIIPGSGPMHLFAERLGIPTITGPGSTRLDSGMHAPNEHARISDYLDHVHFTLRTLELLAEEGF